MYYLSVLANAEYGTGGFLRVLNPRRVFIMLMNAGSAPNPYYHKKKQKKRPLYKSPLIITVFIIFVLPAFIFGIVIIVALFQDSSGNSQKKQKEKTNIALNNIEQISSVKNKIKMPTFSPHNSRLQNRDDWENDITQNNLEPPALPRPDQIPSVPIPSNSSFPNDKPTPDPFGNQSLKFDSIKPKTTIPSHVDSSQAGSPQFDSPQTDSPQTDSPQFAQPFSSEKFMREGKIKIYFLHYDLFKYTPYEEYSATQYELKIILEKVLPNQELYDFFVKYDKNNDQVVDPEEFEIMVDEVGRNELYAALDSLLKKNTGPSFPPPHSAAPKNSNKIPHNLTISTTVDGEKRSVSSTDPDGISFEEMKKAGFPDATIESYKEFDDDKNEKLSGKELNNHMQNVRKQFNKER